MSSEIEGHKFGAGDLGSGSSRQVQKEGGGYRKVGGH